MLVHRAVMDFHTGRGLLMFVRRFGSERIPITWEMPSPLKDKDCKGLYINTNWIYLTRAK